MDGNGTLTARLRSLHQQISQAFEVVGQIGFALHNPTHLKTDAMMIAPGSLALLLSDGNQFETLPSQKVPELTLRKGLGDYGYFSEPAIDTIFALFKSIEQAMRDDEFVEAIGHARMGYGMLLPFGVSPIHRPTFKLKPANASILSATEGVVLSISHELFELSRLSQSGEPIPWNADFQAREDDRLWWQSIRGELLREFNIVAVADQTAKLSATFQEFDPMSFEVTPRAEVLASGRDDLKRAEAVMVLRDRGKSDEEIIKIINCRIDQGDDFLKPAFGTRGTAAVRNIIKAVNRPKGERKPRKESGG